MFVVSYLILIVSYLIMEAKVPLGKAEREVLHDKVDEGEVPLGETEGEVLIGIRRKSPTG